MLKFQSLISFKTLDKKDTNNTLCQFSLLLHADEKVSHSCEKRGSNSELKIVQFKFIDIESILDTSSTRVSRSPADILSEFRPNFDFP